MTQPQVPADRYGKRAEQRPRRGLRWLLATVTVLLGLGVAYIGYQNQGTQPITGEQVAFDVLDDHSVHITFRVVRDDPSKPADCVVRAREESGAEVGRKEVLIPAADGPVTHETVLRTSARATTGEVFGCTYTIPEYLSSNAQPVG